MEENIISDPENDIQLSEPEEEEEINPNDSDDGKRFDDFSEGGFIASFCQLEGNDFFVEIDEEFIMNRSYFFGISKNFKNFE
jgi:hypothetical protein